VIFVVDLTDASSLQYVNEFLTSNANALQLNKFLLLCTKNDLTNDIRITPSAVQQFQNELDKEFPIMNISLTHKKNITPLISFIADSLYNSFEFELSNHLKFQFPIAATTAVNASFVLMNDSLNDDDLHETKTLNVFLLGDDGVGKKTFMKRFFNIDDTSKDIDVLRTYVKIETMRYRLDIWNMSMNRLNEQMFRKAGAFIVMFDLTRKSSFELCDTLYNKITDMKGSEFKVWLVGNKIDVNEREVSMEMVNDMKYEKKIAYAEISALCNINVYDLILTVTLDAYQNNKMGPSSFVIDKHHEPSSKKGGCC
jgi:GTPase SAR1 family protein